MALTFTPLLWLFALFRLSSADITVYYAPGQVPFGTATVSVGGAAVFTGAAVYNTTTLAPPSVPTNPPATSFPIQLQNSGTTGLSIPQAAGFLGFSIEMSVANQVLGKNSTLIQVPFLNLMANLQKRSGRIIIRVGGNSQEGAALVDSLPDGRILAKGPGESNPTSTPSLIYTLDLLYLMRNISDLVNVRWFLGAPFNDTDFRMQIVENGQAILGDYLLGLQVGNEPDLYPVGNRSRPGDYNATNYVQEFGEFITAVNNDPAILNKTMLMGPSISGNGAFNEQDVWDAGFLNFDDSLAYLTVEQ
ncbi:hypothetical protein C8J56DRAFT_795631 [Mycena floridula]|nr:hypothetical protein C8J56DRAFT_795631 [Mycena floridula]